MATEVSAAPRLVVSGRPTSPQGPRVAVLPPVYPTEVTLTTVVGVGTDGGQREVVLVERETTRGSFPSLSYPKTPLR